MIKGFAIFLLVTCCVLMAVAQVSGQESADTAAEEWRYRHYGGYYPRLYGRYYPRYYGGYYGYPYYY